MADLGVTVDGSGTVAVAPDVLRVSLSTQARADDIVRVRWSLLDSNPD
ncbi:MAG: hypothetical protein JWM76_2334 [Pseudonocardiales bacterium]|nr:hypothetical protein [Pseudonocardiales bacterium]